MKKIQLLFLAIMMTGLCTSAFGQESKFEIGAEAGPTIGNLRGNWIAELSKPAVRYSGGISLQYNYNEFLSFRTNLHFERKAVGNKIQYIDHNRTPAGDRKAFQFYDYLTVPLLVRFNMGHNNIKYFVNAGPYVGYLVRMRFLQRPSGEGYTLSSDELNGYNRFNAGLTAGIGGQFALNEQFLFSVELRNNLGLYRLNKQEPVIGGEFQINSTSLLFGLAYPLK